MHGIEGVTGSHNLQLNPYALGQNERELINLDPLNPYCSIRGLEGTGGGEAKLIVNDSVVLDGTINPDFSDVESDQPQFTVNQRYPVYFPELRPFFLENANYFTTPIDLVYTRNIVHPEYGIRLTGKIGVTNLGFFAIDDREPGETYAPDDPLYLDKGQILRRARLKDLGKNSSVGLIFTDQEFGGGWNRVGGLDFTARLNKSWTALGQWVECSTMGPDAPPDRPRYAAGPPANWKSSVLATPSYLDSLFKDYSTGFQTQLGFIPTTDLYNDQTHATYLWYPKKRAVQSFGLDAVHFSAWDHQGNRLYHYFTFSPLMTFRASLKSRRSSDKTPIPSARRMATHWTHNVNFTENFGGLVVRGAPYSQLNFLYRTWLSHWQCELQPRSGRRAFAAECRIGRRPSHSPADQAAYRGQYLSARSRSFRCQRRIRL